MIIFSKVCHNYVQKLVVSCASPWLTLFCLFLDETLWVVNPGLKVSTVCSYCRLTVLPDFVLNFALVDETFNEAFSIAATRLRAVVADYTSCCCFEVFV